MPKRVIQTPDEFNHLLDTGECVGKRIKFSCLSAAVRKLVLKMLAPFVVKKGNNPDNWIVEL